MIERLDQVFLIDFIDISCGKYECLHAKDEALSEKELRDRAFKLIAEYRSITNSSGMRALLYDHEDKMKVQAKLLSLRICKALLSFGFYVDVRQILAKMGVDVQKRSDEQIVSQVDLLIRTAIFEQKRMIETSQERHDEEKTTSQIRSSFDSEIAFLMTYFKMNIDIRTISATVYANIVHQADTEISMRKRYS